MKGWFATFDMTSSINRISQTEKIDQYILDIAQTRGKNAMTQLYLSTKDAVYGYALSILKNSQDAEDVLHDCYIAILQSAKDYVSAGKPMAWIFRITRNLCYGKLKKRSRYSDIPEEDWENYLEKKEDISCENRMVLEFCLRDLQNDEREILLLHVFSGLKHREIAELMHRPLSTILSKYNRTLKKLRILLEGEIETDG